MDCIQVDYIGLKGVNQGNNGDTMGAGKVTEGFRVLDKRGRKEYDTWQVGGNDRQVTCWLRRCLVMP